MINLLILLLTFSFSATAQETLNWQPLEVTVKKEKPKTKPIDTTSAFAKMNSQFKSLVTELHESFERKEKESNRTVEAVNKETVYSDIVEMLEESFPGGLEARLQANEDMEDTIYRLIMMLPKYAYQYIGPFIHEMPYVPDRILNIPGIKETKGKFPTRIAPQMKKYAEKYKDYMSTHLYIYLMPEAWATIEQEKETFKGYSKVIKMDKNTTPDDFFYIYNPTLLDRYKMLSPKQYQTGEALKAKKQPQTPANKVTKDSALTTGDVEAAMNSFTDIEKTLGTNRFSPFRSRIRDMSLEDNNMMGELLNPMQELADKIKRMPEKEEFEEALAKNGFTLDSWAYTVDKIIKARRVESMSPAVAMTLNAWRRLKAPPKTFDVLTPHDKKVSWDTIQLFLGMYRSKPENVLAVKNYSDNIRKTFATRDMLYLEMPIYGIY